MDEVGTRDPIRCQINHATQSAPFRMRFRPFRPRRNHDPSRSNQDAPQTPPPHHSADPSPSLDPPCPQAVAHPARHSG